MSLGVHPLVCQLRVSSTDHPRGLLTRSVPGDIRSRLVRMIPPAPQNSTLGAVHSLLSYRLPANVSEREAREEWRDIIEGHSPLWSGIPNDRKETIRGPSWLLHDVYAQVNRTHELSGTRFSRLL